MAQIKAIIDKLLTGASSGYIPSGYVSEAAFANIPVAQLSGKLGKYSDSHLRLENTLMAGEAMAKRVKAISRTNASYLVERHGLEGVVTDDDYRNVEKPFDAERDEAIGLSTLLWIDKEKELADMLGTAANYSVGNKVQLSGTSQYSDYTNSNPIANFKDARNGVRTDAGFFPDLVIMNAATANTLAYHPGILTALGFTQNRAGQLSQMELAKAMGVERLLISEAQYNSAKEGQTSSRADILGKHIVFAKAPMKPAMYQVSMGYYITLAGEMPRQVYKYAINNPPGATGIIVQDSYDFMIVNYDFGYLIEDAIA